jgi:hypothetical protein
MSLLRGPLAYKQNQLSKQRQQLKRSAEIEHVHVMFPPLTTM